MVSHGRRCNWIWPRGVTLRSRAIPRTYSLGMQVLLESQGKIEQALEYIAELREAWPECLKGIKTVQLAQEMLMYKEDYIKEIAQTGYPSPPLPSPLEPRLARQDLVPPWRGYSCAVYRFLTKCQCSDFDIPSYVVHSLLRVSDPS